MPQNSTFLDRLFDRLDRLDPANVQSYVQRLVREKGFLETVFNTIHEGIVVLDAGLRIRYSNQASRDLLGLGEGSDGRPLGRYVKDVDWASLVENFLTSGGQRMGVHEIEVFYPRNRLLTFYLVPHPSDEDEDGAMHEQYTLIFQDVTAQRMSTEAVIESEKVEAITQLAAGVAHEIGNPLNSLTIHLQLLRRALGGDVDEGGLQDARELLQVALQEVSRLDSITNEFLRAVRPTSPSMGIVRVQEVLADVVGFMRHEIEDRGVRVEATLPDQLPVIRGDVAQLKQVFFNILKNALQAMGEGGLITVECRSGNDFVEIHFTDTGKGISQEHLGRILEPYFTTRADGTGLGLLIVERIVRAHGGEIGIESEEGVGTTVSVRLPRRERQARLLTAARDDGDGGN